MKTRRENHFVVIHDTETKRWYIADAGDFMPSGPIWDKNLQDWVDWDESCNDEEYGKDYQFLEQTLKDYNIFIDNYLSK